MQNGIRVDLPETIKELFCGFDGNYWYVTDLYGNVISFDHFTRKEAIRTAVEKVGGKYSELLHGGNSK